jgi:hypothetical protein
MSSSEPVIKYAFYREGNKAMKGEPVFNGRKSDGLERSYFGSDLGKIKSMVAAARGNSREYRVYKYTYTAGIGATECKIDTVYRSPAYK